MYKTLRREEGVAPEQGKKNIEKGVGGALPFLNC